ncbi:hypothetical protein GCM10022286_05580 [Gryllotalpicola daejeonensis]|uniref:Phage gp6-like head-tail connector protein n=1 Tax=Gryllotalpicola daejeonensis TaxID=993087 RepID=A0ABP7ZF82_9MICO
MTVTASDLATYLGVPDSEDAFVDTCLTRAQTFVGEMVGTRTVPGDVLDQAVTEMAAELYNRKNVKNGVVQFADLSGSSGAVRQARDPRIAARAVLRPYLGAGFR